MLDFWLDGRMEEARRILSHSMWWMTGATMLLLAAVLELVLGANLDKRPMDAALMWIVLGSYFAFTLWWLVRFFQDSFKFFTSMRNLQNG